jgi:hypothetical protein
VYALAVALVEADRELREVGRYAGGQHAFNPTTATCEHRHGSADENLIERFDCRPWWHHANAGTNATSGDQMSLAVVATFTGLCFAGAVAAITIGLSR